MRWLDCELEIKSLTEEGEFTGYGSVFNNVDHHRDVVRPGAFKDSLKKIGTPMMSLMHRTEAIAGAWKTVKEDRKGLAVHGKLALGTQSGDESHIFMKMDPPAIRGLSIGYMIPEGGSEFDRKRQIRILKKIDLYDVSLVTAGANPQARVESIKSVFENGEIPTKTDFAVMLRSCGLSRNQAQQVICGGYDGLKPGNQDNTASYLKHILSTIQEATP